MQNFEQPLLIFLKRNQTNAAVELRGRGRVALLVFCGGAVGSGSRFPSAVGLLKPATFPCGRNGEERACYGSVRPCYSAACLLLATELRSPPKFPLNSARSPAPHPPQLHGRSALLIEIEGVIRSGRCTFNLLLTL